MTTPHQSPLGKPPLILIVDDIADNRILLDRALQSSGYATAQAASGREALSLTSANRPNIILLDWMMPGLSGIDTLRALRERHPKTRLPVIMCTALDEDVSVVRALGEGANDYITKPINIAILRARIRSQLDQQSAIDTLATEKMQAERKLGEQARAIFSVMSTTSRLGNDR
jgi:DNA-binding response OmpR family regulator